MAVLDKFMILSNGQTMTTVGTRSSTNVIYVGAGYNAFGSAVKRQNEADPARWFVNCRVVTAFTSGGSGTLTLAVQTSTVEGSGYASVFTTAAIAVASLVVGYYALRIPLPMGTLNDYVKILYTIGTTAMTAGAVDSWIGQAGETNK